MDASLLSHGQARAGRAAHPRAGASAHAEPAAGTTRAVDRALAVLCAFSRETPILGVTELSEQLGLTKSTVHRLLQVLLRRGMVARDASQRGYTLGYRVLALAQAVQGEATLRQICQAPMQWLRTVTQETVGLYVIAGDVRLCLEELESPQMLRMTAGVGRCFPLDRGAASKALLADGPASADAWHRATAALPAARREWLLGEVEQLKTRGYAISSGETVPGSASIAAPVRDATGSVTAAISVGGPSSRFTDDTIPTYAGALLEAVERIRRDLEAAHAPVARAAR